MTKKGFNDKNVFHKNAIEVFLQEEMLLFVSCIFLPVKLEFCKHLSNNNYKAFDRFLKGLTSLFMRLIYCGG